MVRISRISENSLRIMAARKQLLYYTCSLIGCGPNLSIGPDRSMARVYNSCILHRSTWNGFAFTLQSAAGTGPATGSSIGAHCFGKGEAVLLWLYAGGDRLNQ